MDDKSKTQVQITCKENLHAQEGVKKKIRDNIQWNLSFGIPLFKGQGLHSGNTKFGPGETPT